MTAPPRETAWLHIGVAVRIRLVEFHLYPLVEMEQGRHGVEKCTNWPKSEVNLSKNHQFTFNFRSSANKLCIEKLPLPYTEKTTNQRIKGLAVWVLINE